MLPKSPQLSHKMHKLMDHGACQECFSKACVNKRERERELKMLGQNEVCLAPINKSSVSEASQRVKAIMLQLSVA